MSIGFALGKTPVVVLIGSPGSGKETQSIKISNNYSFTRISTGDILRNEVKSGSPKALEMKKTIDSGQLVPKEFIETLMKEYMLGAVSQKTKGFIVDGYPRDIAQGESFERKFKKPDVIIYLEVSDQTILKRLKERTGTSGRADDNTEAIAKRLRQFKESTLLLVDHYKKEKVCQVVNGDRDPDQVFGDIQKILDAKYKNL
ncbi:Adenylate kinase isoenzyme 1 [Strongyloides ratti]|uniref:Adenylate kinase isoenzyme 1 n=1 Tax=Strongyloides ratti TaxID=34506 RepID=A0A090L3J8_STRRB|nr:Adenylate kinase isoenzyme 1 [Strongyloides ratti]CEF62672.1 Adenylate kinase isoenzyme 1 [Strongyloides ratti]